jgi:nucleotide-binding universal stress UspA family protein
MVRGNVDQPPFFRTILVGDNGTPDAARAVAVAMSLGEKYKAKVILLGVLVPPSAEALAEGYGLTDPALERRKLDEHLQATAQAAQRAGVEVVVEMVKGMPEESIEKRVKQGAIDLVVVGHRKIGRLRGWLEHSTSEGLVRRCPVSVLVVHDCAPES